MTSTLALDLDMVKMNQYGKQTYVGQKLFSSKVIFRTRTHTHTRPIALPEPQKWSVKSSIMFLTTACITTVSEHNN